MSSIQGRKPKQPNYFLPAIGILGGIIAIVVTVGVLLAPKSAEQLGREFDAQSLSDPDAGPVVRILQSEFPNDYAQLRAEAVAVAQANGSEEDLRAVMAKGMQGIMVRNVNKMILAPSSHLKVIQQRRLNLLNTLQAESPDQCARMLKSGVQPGDNYSPKVVKAMTQLSEAKLAAAAAGRISPRFDLPASPGDAEAWLEAMRNAGATKSQLAIIQDTKRITTASPTEVCSTFIISLQAQSRLPDDVAGRIAVDQLQQETGTKPASLQFVENPPRH